MDQNTEQKNKIISENLAHILLQKYVPYWPILSLSLIIAIGVAYSYLSITKPIYLTQATLLMQDETKGTKESDFIESFDRASPKKIIENEVQILQSRKLMLEVICDLGLYANLSHIDGIKTVSAWHSSPIVVYANDPAKLTHFENIPIRYVKERNQVVVANKKVYAMDQWVNTPYGELKFLRNPNYQKQKKSHPEFFLSLNNPNNLASQFLASLNVQASGKLSSFIHLSFEDEVPDRGEKVLNHLVSSYARAEIGQKATLAKKSEKFLKERLEETFLELDSIERKIQLYKSENRAVDIGSQGSLYLSNISENDQKLSAINTQISIVRKVKSLLSRNGNPGSTAMIHMAIQDPVLFNLIESLQTVELEYVRQRNTMGENHPHAAASRKRIELLKRNIASNIETQLESLNTTRESILQTNDRYNGILNHVPLKERELLLLAREQHLKSGLYSFLLQKLEDSKLAYVSKVSNIRVIDEAYTTSKPVSPKKPFTYALSLILIPGLTFSIITLREIFSTKILYRSEIEQLSKIPIIAEINYNKAKTPIVISKGKRGIWAEDFRKLRVILSISAANQPLKKVLVTSGISGEGKSFVAANLAISIALSGLKVVLLDSDLTKPSLSHLFKVGDAKGFAEFLNGDLDFEDTLYRTNHENLFIIPAGKIRGNSSEAITDPKLKQLLDRLETTFERIIIDSAPLEILTDGFVLASFCDTSLFVVRHNFTPKTLLHRMEENNRIQGFPNPFLVFNGIKKRGFTNRRGTYGYGYDYSREYRDHVRVASHLQAI